MWNFVGVRLGSLGLALVLIACSVQADQTTAAAGQTEEDGLGAAATGVSGAQSETDAPADGSAPMAAAASPPAHGPAGAVGTGSSGRDRAVFEAAGFSFVQQRGQWESGACGDPPLGVYEPGTIGNVEDMNGDGRPEAIVTEGGTCYGNTGVRFWLLSQQANGQWKVMTDSIAIPDLLATRGVDNFPDVQGGGPGFCFPVARWNGREYKVHRYEYEGRPCAPAR